MRKRLRMRWVPLLVLLLLAALWPPWTAAAGTVVRVNTNWAQYGAVQTDMFQLTAGAAGELVITLRSDGAPAAVGLTLLDDQRDVVILDAEPVVTDEVIYRVHLSRTGSYTLMVADNRLMEIELEGTGLTLSPVTPALLLPYMEHYQTQNDPFMYGVTVPNAGEVEWVTILLNGDPVVQTAVQPAGGPEDVLVDTGALADGLHELRALGKTWNAENYAFAGQWILVDRIDAFADVPPTHWARRYVEVMHHLGIINGREGGYQPAEPVTRAEFAKLMTLALDLPVNPDTPNPFADLDGHWARPHILALWLAGLVTGEVVDGQRYFYPNRTMSRAEAATILGRATGVSNAPLPDEPPFTDWAEVPSWARPSVAALAKMGWITGFPDGRYGPTQQLQRDQAAKLIARFFGM